MGRMGPSPTAFDSHGALERTFGIGCGRGAEIRSGPIETPFLDITVKIVKPPWVGKIGANALCSCGRVVVGIAGLPIEEG